MSSYYLIALAGLGVIFFLLLRKFNSRKSLFWEEYGVPTLEIGNVLVRSAKQMSFVEEDGVIYKQMKNLKYAGLQDTGMNIFFVKDLDLAKQIYVKDFDYFVNRRNVNESDKTWNKILVNKMDKEWKDMRSTMSPTFTTGKIRRMFPILRESAEKFVNYTNKILKAEGEIIIEEALGRFCMDAICSISFDIDSEVFHNENSVVAHKAKKLHLEFNTFTTLRSFLLSFTPKWVKERLEPPFINPEANEFFTKMLTDTILHRETSGSRRNDFLQLLLDAKHGRLAKEDEELDSFEKDAELYEDKNKKSIVMTNDLIIANSLLFIIAGFDSMKSGVVFGAYALAINPEVQDKLRNELQTAIQENGGEFSYDLCNTNEYLEKFTCEIYRMYSPGIRIERVCTKDYPLENSNSFVPKGSIVWFPVYQIHHDEQHFPNPNKFDPERFSSEEKTKRHPYAYMAFGHGPRNCIGNRFAMIKTKAVLAALVLNFDVEPTAKTPIPLTFCNTGMLTAAKPLYLKLTPRKK